MNDLLKELSDLNEQLKLLRHPAKLRMHMDRNLSTHSVNANFERISIFYNEGDKKQSNLANAIGDCIEELRGLYIQLSEERLNTLKKRIMEEIE